LRTRLLTTALLAVLTTWGLAARAAEYDCRVTDVWSPLVVPEVEYLERVQPTLHLSDTDAGVFVTRCARDPARKETHCERIQIDWVTRDDARATRKFYRIDRQYDLQLFFDRTFVENDGNGTVYHGRCNAVAAQAKPG